MNQTPTVHDVISDVKVRTLSHIPSDLAKLVYLASTRDYNTGQYFHDGLASRFSEALSEIALEICHEQVFDGLLHANLEQTVREMSAYITSTREDPATVIHSWAAQKPYQLLPPTSCKTIEREYFLSNLRFSIEILLANPRWQASAVATASPRQ